MSFQRPVVVIDAPTNLGLRPPAPGRVPGVYQMPNALRARGLVERLDAIEGGRVVPAAYSPEWHPGFGTRNAESIRAFSLDLADRVGREIDAGRFPLVIGGDCSVVLGNMLALRRRGRFGLVYLDGHTDFRHMGNADAVGAVAGEDLAILTGRGSDRLADIDRLRPYVRETDVIALGDREGDPAATDIFDTAITVWDLAHVRRTGAGETAHHVLEHMRTQGIDGFWIHVDVDVLNNDVMPAVDSPQSDGLTYEELSDLVRPLLHSQLAVGMEVTIYDPDLDPDGSIGAGLVDAIVELFAG